MRTDRERMPIILRRTERGLEARSRLAHEALARIAVHSDVEVTVKKRRSNPQNAAYWAMLARVIEATDAYPSAEHLHEATKLALGYTMPVKTLDGGIVYLPDSTAFGKMDASQFASFFDAAIKLIAERFGIDPAELREAA